MHKAFLLPVIEFLLPEEVPTASEESCHCQKKEKPLLDSYEVPASAATTGTASDETGKKKGRTVTVTAEDMQKRKNDVKERTTLRLSLPDEQQLRFSKYKTAQELWAAILKTFGGNEATKKTKKSLLKKQYGNFKAEGLETLEQTFNKLQDWSYMANDEENHALVAKKEAPIEFAESKVFDNSLCSKDCKKNTDSLNKCIVLGRNFKLSDDDNVLLRTPRQHNMYSIDLNNIVPHKDLTCLVAKASADECMLWHRRLGYGFISSSKNSSNEDGNSACVTTASTAFPIGSVNVATISQDTASTYIASQSNGSQIKFEDINQIDEDDMEEMDIKWSMALLSMRADKFWKRTRKKISIQGSDVAGFDKSKVECFNCHKMGHFNMALLSMRADKFWKKTGKKISIQGTDVAGFDKSKVECFNCNKICHVARECRGLRSQDRGRRDNYRQGSKVEEQAPKALMAIDKWDETGAIWRMMNRIMHCKIIDLTDKLFDDKNMIYHYKLGLVQVESRLVEHKDREIKYCEKIRGLEFKTESSDDYIKILKKELETLKKEKEGLDSKLACFQTASKDIDSLLESQRLDKNKEGLGYNDVPPHLAQIYSSLKKDMSWTGLLEFKDDTVTDYSRHAPTVESSQDDAQNRNPFVTETEESISIISPKSFIKFVKANDIPTKNKIDKAEKAKKSPVKKFPTGGTKFHTTDMGKKGKAGSSQNNIDDKGYWDSGCSRHMTGNISYLSDYEPLMEDMCLWLSDDDNVLLRTPRQHNMYSIDLNNIVSHKDLTCLVAKASADECMLWHRRLGKQHKASCKSTLVNSISKPLHTLHMDLFGPNSISSISHKWYCLVLTNDFSRFTWTFFLKTKDDTSGNLRKFITEIENLKDLKVKIIRCDNGGEFRNKEMNDFCSQKGIKREFSNARTPQQNGVEWVLVNKSQNKTPYELFNGRTPAIGFLKPFGCHVMILNTLDNLGKFEEKGDEGTKDAANQEVKKNVSSLRYIALPNWVHDALLESSSSKPQDDCSTDVPESSGNSNPTATSTNPPADQLETLTVETPIPTVSLPVPTACFTDSPEPLSDARLISKRVANQVETPSLDNILTLANRFEDILGVTTNSDEPNGVEADSKEVGEQSFIATIHQKTDPALLQFCLFSCFLSQVKHKKIYDALQDPSWMDVKSAFLYGTIDEKVYVMQPPGFQDPEFPAKVYKVEKAMYGLHQAPRACDYGGATQDRKSTTRGCQFLGRRLISWQCKKQTIVATSTTEAEYVAAASCCGQVLWILNQLLDYGYNFMNTKIYIDNNSDICIVKNPVYHSKTKHIEIRHHFIRDCFEKMLISMDHIHNDENVADLLTKPFDAGRF
nr:putative ribonuclease H-like domain-containing protein [Tanacetum cinerariifolium]